MFDLHVMKRNESRDLILKSYHKDYLQIFVDFYGVWSHSQINQCLVLVHINVSQLIHIKSCELIVLIYKQQPGRELKLLLLTFTNFEKTFCYYTSENDVKIRQFKEKPNMLQRFYSK